MNIRIDEKADGEVRLVASQNGQALSYGFASHKHAAHFYSLLAENPLRYLDDVFRDFMEAKEAA